MPAAAMRVCPPTLCRSVWYKVRDNLLMPTFAETTSMAAVRALNTAIESVRLRLRLRHARSTQQWCPAAHACACADAACLVIS